jgi:hypothetical protein
MKSSYFVEETDVFITNIMGNKKIKDVIIGDVVCNHNGGCAKVIQIYKTLLENNVLHSLYIISGTGYILEPSELIMTSNQRFLSSNKKFIEVNEILPGDYIRSANHGYCKVISNTVLSDFKPEYVYTLGVELNNSFPVGKFGLFTESKY